MRERQGSLDYGELETFDLVWKEFFKRKQALLQNKNKNMTELLQRKERAERR